MKISEKFKIVFYYKDTTDYQQISANRIKYLPAIKSLDQPITAF